MRTARLLFFIIFVSASLHTYAQKRVALEKIRYATTINYFADPSVQQQFAVHLNQLLTKHYGAILTDTGSLQLQNAEGNLGIFRQRMQQWADTSTWHMLVDVLEYAPQVYFTGLGVPAANAADSANRARTRTVFRFGIRIERSDETPVSFQVIDAIISNTRSTGMGLVSRRLALVPKTFLEIAKRMASALLDPANDLEQIGMGVAPIYMADDFLMPALNGKQRVLVQVNGNGYSFNRDSLQLLRKGEPLYEQIIWKGRRSPVYPKAVMDAIDKADNRAASDFVFLKQEWRDVLRDRNYLVRLVIQVDPYKNYGIPAQALTGFLPGDLHVLLKDNDTLARFSIDKYVTDAGRKIYPNRLYNGADSSSIYTVGDPALVWPFKYNYVVKGSLGSEAFEIRTSGADNGVKEFYLGGNLVCIAQGVFGPEMFAVFDATLSNEKMKQLFMIGFNRFFE